MFFIGAALMKMGFWNRGFSAQTLWLMVLVGYGVGFTGRYFYISAEVANDFDQHSVYAYREVGPYFRLAVTMGHLALITLFCRSGWLGWLQSAVGSVGRMALTNYIAQTVLASIYFYGFAMGNFGQLDRMALYGVVAAVWLFNILFSVFWLKYFLYGPLEWVWRALTYGARPKMKRI